MCKRLKHVVFVHKKIIERGEYAVSGFGGGGFSLVDHDFEIWEKSAAAKLTGKKLIFLSHAPPYGNALDLIYEEHAGSKSLTRFIKQTSPAVVVCGHLHENAGRKDKLGKTLIVNPGATGAIIELK
jgi:Icc-related predicted phosphoesterase